MTILTNIFLTFSCQRMAITEHKIDYKCTKALSTIGEDRTTWIDMNISMYFCVLWTGQTNTRVSMYVFFFMARSELFILH